MRTLDQLILETAPQADTVVIADDPSGDLLAHTKAIRVVCISSDFTQCERALQAGVEVAGDRRLDQWLTGDGSCVVIGQMPKSLARLDYVARAVAGAGFDEATLVFGGNNKHLARSMNDVLEQSFEQVSASRGKGKFRCLVAARAKEVAYTPVESHGITAIGGVFSGAKEDLGGRFLGEVVVDKQEALGRVLDLGCGNGSVSKRILQAYPATEVVATDADADAVLSARGTLSPWGVAVTWDDAGAQLAGDFDTVLLNPPFHDGTTVDATLVEHLLDASHRLLKPGGQVFLVHNSHLRYRESVEKRFSQVRQAARNNKFTVLYAVK
ncbi:methyltransferase [Corynebacterium breve]|uniref:Methyltransferase n=1 Tax=Corynebacterium breve TaxID=3049799 RepID=A0ABY8VCL3_9CORY|nr:methyltransferase [Corynebacterium breve]WIM66857.1 methyltransferase [Corynebacterium breve]